MTREMADRILRVIWISTVVGVVVIVIAAIIVSEHRGLLLLVAAVYLIVSLSAQVPLRRSLNREVERRERQQGG